MPRHFDGLHLEELACQMFYKGSILVATCWESPWLRYVHAGSVNYGFRDRPSLGGRDLVTAVGSRMDAAIERCFFGKSRRGRLFAGANMGYCLIFNQKIPLHHFTAAIFVFSILGKYVASDELDYPGRIWIGR